MEEKTTTIKNLAAALCKAQGQMSGAKKSTVNPFFKSNYADLSSVFDALREPFASNGLSVCQTMDVLDNGMQVLITRLMHSSGEFIDSKMLLPTDPNPQKLGSCITYYRRYALMAISGISAEDDDGNQASSNKVISDVELAQLYNLLAGDSNAIDATKVIMERLKIKSIRDIRMDRFPSIMTWLAKRIEEQKAVQPESKEDVHNLDV